MALIQLVYISAATQLHDDATLTDLMQSSSVRNKSVDITGMLLYCDGFFIQVLEGEESTVDTVFSRILKDLRHKDVITILRGPIDERSFAHWSMGFRILALGETKAHPAYAPLFSEGFAVERFVARPGLAVELLSEFGRSSPPAGP